MSRLGYNAEGQFSKPSDDFGPQHGIVKQHVSISSKDRVEGYPGQFVINLLPRGMTAIVGVELLSFVGQLHPYNVLQNSIYKITQDIDNGGGHHTITTYTFKITAGDYSIKQLILALNMQPLLRFSYNHVTGKMIAETLSGVTGTVTGAETPQVNGATYIGPLIGFPSGFTIVTASGSAVQSTFAVSPHSSVSSIIVGFDEIPPGVVTTGNISSGFTIPVNQFSYNKDTRQVHFSAESNFRQQINFNGKTIGRLYVKIQNQTIPGRAFRYVGEVYMDLNIYYIGGSVPKN